MASWQKGFLWGALIGVLNIGVITLLDSHSSTGLSSTTMFLLWPTSIVGFGYNGGQPLLTFVIGTIEIVGNALIFGGLVAGLTGMMTTLIKQRKN